MTDLHGNSPQPKESYGKDLSREVADFLSFREERLKSALLVDDSGEKTGALVVTVSVRQLTRFKTFLSPQHPLKGYEKWLTTKG